MENNICYFCKNSTSFNFLEAHSSDGQEYKLYECQNCHAQFWEPFKNPGAQWYEKDERYSGRNAEHDAKFAKAYTKVLDFLKPLKGDVLDVGCGTGSFLYWAQKDGWGVAGLDFDKEAVRVAQDVFKLDGVEVNDLSGYYRQNQNKKFDLVTFFEVFEHIDNHHEFIGLTKELLKEGGYIALSMPCRDMAKWLNPHDLPPRHLTRWDISSLTNFLESNGFKVVYKKREATSLKHVMIKLRFRFGKRLSLNLVAKQKTKMEKAGNPKSGSTKISIIHLIAKVKDWVIFGLPAVLVWLVLLPTSKKYISLYVIAREK